MRLRKETCVTINNIAVEYKVPSLREKGKKRAPKINPTPEDVRKVNDRNAEKELGRTIDNNFIPGDWHLVLTYSGKEPTQEEAKDHFDKFKENLRKKFKSLGIILKWVAVTEYSHDRIHHHIVCSKIDFEILTALWPHGDVRPSILKQHRNYRKLAAYLIKETSKTSRLPESVNRRRYNCSRTIVKPEVRYEYVSSKDIEDDPEPIKDYYIDQDSIRRGWHEVTGYPYLEYTMLPLIEDEPRIKKWRRGKKVTGRENYNYLLRGIVVGEQLDMGIGQEEREHE